MSNLQVLKWYALKATEQYDVFIKTQSVDNQIKSVLLGFPFLTSAIKAVGFRNIATHNDDAISQNIVFRHCKLELINAHYLILKN